MVFQSLGWRTRLALIAVVLTTFSFPISAVRAQDDPGTAASKEDEAKDVPKEGSEGSGGSKVIGVDKNGIPQVDLPSSGSPGPGGGPGGGAPGGVGIVRDPGEMPAMPGSPAPPFNAQTEIEKLNKTTVPDAAVAGHNAWMLVSSALVLFMTVPGLAMFYGGLVRKKNVLSVLMQCIFLMGLMGVIWATVGYSWAFGSIADRSFGSLCGDTEYLFMNNVTRTWDEATKTVTTPMFKIGETPYFPLSTHMLFQGMFFIITPGLICGAFAERMKFSAMVVFSILWGLIVYCPLCHWVWDGGILAYNAPEALLNGSIDFAGGTVVHISSGVSALICAVVLGKRLGFGQEPMPPHNLTYTVIGAGMLWVGWFGFNAGSALASDGVASQAFMNTHFSAAAGTLAWAGIEWVTRGKASALGAASGAVAGLVCITPGAGFVLPMHALIMGFAAGIVCFFACSSLKGALGYDDSLDAFGVHGVGGTLGAILTGVFGTRMVTDPAISLGKPMGLYPDGDVKLLIGNIVATAVTWCLSIAATFVILKVVDLTIGLRVSRDDEQVGLDQSQHGEEGYIQI
jgi:Amt family ammonium transporter